MEKGQITKSGFLFSEASEDAGPGRRDFPRPTEYENYPAALPLGLAPSVVVRFCCQEAPSPGETLGEARAATIFQSPRRNEA